MMNVQQQIDTSERNLDRLLDWISRLDGKSSLVLGIDTAMLGVLAGFAPRVDLWTVWMAIIAGVAIGMLAASLCFIYLANYPRTIGPRKSLLYFGSIAGMTFNEYQQSFANMSESQFLNDLLEQCHRNSEIITRKFWALKWAFITLLLAVVPWLVSLYRFKFLEI